MECSINGIVLSKSEKMWMIAIGVLAVLTTIAIVAAIIANPPFAVFCGAIISAMLMHVVSVGLAATATISGIMSANLLGGMLYFVKTGLDLHAQDALADEAQIISNSALILFRSNNTRRNNNDNNNNNTTRNNSDIDSDTTDTDSDNDEITTPSQKSMDDDAPTLDQILASSATSSPRSFSTT